jgi:hypothetical protein
MDYFKKPDKPSNHAAPGQAIQPAVVPVAFGVIGSNTSKKLEGGWIEITRLEGDIDYRSPPLPSVWSKNAKHTYSIIWPGDPINQNFPSLKTLGEKFRKEKAFITESLLIELDKKFAAYLTVLETLEKSGWTQGLVCPSSILFKSTSGETVTVLPDLGFHWTGIIGTPHWLANHPGNYLLGDETATKRMRAWEASADKNEKIKEVRIAALMLADCVDYSEISLKGLLKDSTVGERQSLGFLKVLRNAIEGKYTSTSEFREEILRNPPSKSRTLLSSRRSEQTNNSFSKKLGFAIIILIFLTLIGLPIFYISITNSNQEKTPTTDETKTGPNGTGKKTEGNGTGTGTESNDSYKKILELCAKDKLSNEEKIALQDNRNTFTKYFKDNFKKISDKYASDQDRTSAANSIKTIISQMQSVIKCLGSISQNKLNEEESQCLAFAEAFLVQLSQ